MIKSSRDHYKTGKGKPPIHSRWKKGQSGNPGGRKKGATTLKGVWESVLMRPITVKANNEPLTVTTLEGIVMRMADSALKGDDKAGRVVLEHAERSLDAEPVYDAETPEEDLEILRRAFSDPQLRRQMRGEQEQQQDPDPSGSHEGDDD